MFGYRDTRSGTRTVEVAFTDASLDLQGRAPGFPAALAALERATGVHFARLSQVHGREVVRVEHDPGPGPLPDVPAADALVTDRPGIGLMVRAADCVPVLLADVEAGVVGAAHAGRNGTALDVVGHTVTRLRELGAQQLTAWIGPHVCGRCYEVPEAMQAQVVAAVPAAYAVTRAGTPGLDLGAGVRSQLVAREVDVVEVGGCTLEDPTYWSYRRSGAAAGRAAGLVWIAPGPEPGRSWGSDEQG